MDRLLRRAAASLLFLFAGAAAFPTAAKPQFFAAPPVVPKSADAPDVKSQASPVRFNAKELLALAPTEEVQLNLPSGATYDVVFQLGTDHGGGIASWVGGIKGHESHYRVIVTTGPSGTFGSIDTPEGTYRIVPGERNDWLVDMTLEAPHIPRSNLGDDERDVISPKSLHELDLSRATFSPAIPGVTIAGKATPVPQVTVDMMFVVTRALADRLGGGLATRLNFLVTRANDSYAASEVAITMRMVHFMVVDYTDGGDNGDALDDITNGVGVFAGVEAARTAFGADMVALLRNGSGSGGSGVAWRPSNPAASSNLMYSVTTGCVTGCESVFIHEVGHNMGNSHDRRTASWQANAGLGYTSIAATSSFGYAFCKTGTFSCNAFTPNGCGGNQPECGADDPSNFSDLMAYFHGTTTNLYKFSNPNVACRSTAAGNDNTDRPCGPVAADPEFTNPGPADTVTSMNNNRVGLSAIKAGLGALPGYVQFTATGYSATEASGTMTFTVSRLGGSTGAISVNYAVTNGTAVGGTDFTAANGTLNWANGDTANKTFTVTLTNDGVAEGAESFTATLSNAAGTPGAYVGFPSSAAGLIIEDFGGAAGGALPAGFTSTDWTVANDQANDGTTSLRSAKVHGNFGSAANSDMTFTGNIPAGTIAFAYRVSSYQGLGTFEFSVDGSNVLTATGETGWRLFTYNLPTGGNHTLRWRFANQLPSSCSGGWNPAPEGGGACADRVWIDSVSLPSAAPPAMHALTVAKAGAGTGTVTSAPAGITCGPTCSANFVASTVVTLTAAPDTGSIFAGWTGGGCSGTGTCVVTVTAATGVTATFTPATGTPTGQAAPTSVDFGGQSIQTTAPGTAVTLTNIGTGTLTVTSVSATPASYAVTHNCTSLGTGASCTATVAFTPASQGSIPGTLTFATSAGNVAVPLAGIGELSLVTHYYRAILNRAPDGAGKTFWESEAARLTALGVNINETWFVMAGYFFNSPEYIAANKSDAAFVTDLYNTFFNRAPDSGGLNFWVGQITSGLPREVVLFSFMFSNEFRTFTQGIFGNTAARPEVDMVVDFFRGLLNRLPDTASFNFWLGQLRTAQCQGAGPVFTKVDEISAAFMFNPEYTNRARTNTQFVTDMYYSFLRRGGDVGGVNFWINELNTGARFPNDVRYFGFLNSPEFGARVAAVIAAGCATP